MNVINEVIQRVCDILNVSEVTVKTYDIRFGFRFCGSFTFYHSVSINHILDLHDLYDWNVRCIVDEIIDNIEREFLNETIRQKEN